MKTLIKPKNEEIKISITEVLNEKFLGRVVEAGEDREIFILQDAKLAEDKLLLNGLDDFLENIKVTINLHNFEQFSFKTKENYIDTEDKENCLEIFYKNNKTQIINFL